MALTCNKNSKTQKSSINEDNTKSNGWGLFLSEYTGNSTIHGIRYLTEPKRPLAERIWWIIAFLISLYCCIHLIINIYGKWNDNPVIVSFAEKTMPVWEIPFPGVTICPQIKTRSKIFNFTKNYNLMNGNVLLADEDQRLMTAILNLCDSETVNTDYIEQNYTGKQCIDDLRKMAPSLPDTIDDCKWNNYYLKCTEVFTEIITDIGICYTFNMINADELYRENVLQKEYNYYNHSEKSTNWTLENGYLNEFTKNSYPKRVLSSYKHNSLVFYLRTSEHDIDSVCTDAIQGFKILFHAPCDIPEFKENYHYLLMEHNTLFSLIPKVTNTKGLKNYSPSKRQCFYNDEKYLRFFKVYSQQNCLLECLTNYTLSECQCVKFSMPRDAETRICGTSKIECYRAAEYNFFTSQPISRSDNNVTNGITDCNCLPACTSILYQTEISQIPTDFVDFMKAHGSYASLMDMYPGMKVAKVHISFKDTKFISHQRSEIFGPTDFIANCGGLLGLFMGVSLLSIVEIFYFCTIRLVSNLIRKAPDSDEMNNINLISSDE